MDPLSNVLSLLKPQNHLSAGMEAGGDWSVQFPDQQKGIKCGAMVSGECWLSVDGVADAVRLVPGDCFLLPSGRPFRLASDLDLPSVPAADIFYAERRGGVARVNDSMGAGDVSLVSCRFGLASNHADMLLRVLPPIVVIRDGPGQAALRWSVECMMQELREPQPGGFLMLQHLSHMILVQALRLHLTEGAKGGIGWLSALADRQMCLAISAIHDEPGRRWSLQSLAAEAGMSRSAFAERFRQSVGIAPMDYLGRWRMMLACDRLEKSSDPIARIAPALGYESEAAFSTAFKRIIGCSPRQYVRKAGNATQRPAADAQASVPVAA
ncbi:AraC family transcriptional regulator [Rhizobium sp. 18065]|uniref:AraC family transcriptional regulator n=1 Tax=Rhizobium sp. 18065 TaxID=2681411 RepID=UPI00135A9562|nr:AraC family transcriptional regulator [Rhizobium sp. 18065]